MLSGFPACVKFAAQSWQWVSGSPLPVDACEPAGVPGWATYSCYCSAIAAGTRGKTVLETRQRLCLVSDASDMVFILFYFFSFSFFVFCVLNFRWLSRNSCSKIKLCKSCWRAETLPLFGMKAAAVEMWARAPEHPSESTQGRSDYS